MSNLRKMFTTGVVVITIFWAIGLAAFVPTAQAATLASGDLIKAGLPAVYYYGANGSRYVFPNQKTYMSWYSDFSTVKTITDAELAALPIGGNVTSRPGVKMLKINTDPKVYAVTQNGSLHWVTTEAVASCIYGSSWAGMVDDVSDAFFVNYTVGTPLTDCSQYSKTDAMNASTSINVDKGLGVSGGTGGALQISLASDSPAASSVPGGATPASDVIFAKIKLAAGATAAKITKIRISRTGLSADADLAAVKIWDGANQLDTAQTLNSSHQATFNVNRTIAANSSLTLAVTADLAIGVGLSSSEIKLGVASNTDVISDASSVSGAPVWGNTMTCVNTSVGSLTVAQAGSMPAAASTVDLDQTATFFGARLTAGSVEDVAISSITLNQGNNSSIQKGDLAEIKLINDTTGDTISTLTSVADNGNAVFDLSASPLVLVKGNTRDIILRAKVVNGAGRNVAFDINDGVSFLIKATGKTYGFGVNITNAGAWTTASNGVGVATLINQGKVTVSKAATSPAAGNIARGATEIDIAEYAFDLKGEDVRFGTTVVALNVVSAVGGNCTVIVDNIKLVDSKGNTLAGPVSPTGLIAGGVCTATFTSSYELPNGANTVKVLVNTTSAIANGNSIQAVIPALSFANVRGLTSNKSITVAPVNTPVAGAPINANAQIVKGAALAVEMGATPIIGNVVRGKVGMWIAYVGLDSSIGGEDVRVQSLTLQNVPAATASAAYINAKLIDTATGLQVGQTVQPTSVVAGVSSDLLFTFSGDELVVKKDAQRTLALQIDILSTATANDDFAFDIIAAAGTGKASATAAGLVGVGGVTLSPNQNVLASGTFKVALDPDTATPSQLVSSSIGNSVASYRLEAVDEDINVTELYLVGVNPAILTAVAPGWGSDVLSLDVSADGVKLGSTLSASATGIQLLSLTTPLTIGKDKKTVITVKLNVASKNNVASGDLFRVGIADGTLAAGASFGTTWGGADTYLVTATGKDSGAVIGNINTTGAIGGLIAGGNLMSAHDGVLTVTLNSASPSGLKVAATNQELMRLNLTATGDDITVNAVDLAASSNCVFAGQTTATFLKSVDNAVTYATSSVANLVSGVNPFGPATFAVPLTISKGTTKVVKIEGDTTGCANPKTLQAKLIGGANSVNGVAWAATDAIAIDAIGWAGPATKDLPLTGGAISY